MRIAVLVHKASPEFWQGCHVLRHVAEVWRERGHEIAVVRDPRRPVDADVAILHTDLTKVPPAYLALAARYPVVLNRQVADISKRRVATHLVAAPSADEGPVIVKTDRNAGGEPERILLRGSGLLGRLAARVRRALPGRWTGDLNSRAYPIYRSAREVPGWVFRDKRFVVQRFLAERRDGHYCLRRWTFLGERGWNYLSMSTSPVVKAANVGERVPLGPPPAELEDARRRLGFDYGKLDYGIVDGEVVLYDANRTPSFERGKPPPDAMIRDLAAGIEAYRAAPVGSRAP